MTLEEIKNAIVQLTPSEFAQFSLWFAEFQAKANDQLLNKTLADAIRPYIVPAEDRIALPEHSTTKRRQIFIDGLANKKSEGHL